MLLFYDTETTGLPLWNEPSESPGQPHITQIAAQLCDLGGDVLGSMNVMIRPDGWTIPDDIAKLTGITTEKAAAAGIPLARAMGLFLDLWQIAETRVAHNESFDARMVRIALYRTIEDMEDELHGRWKSGKAFCTQNKSTAILNLPPTDKMMAAGIKKAKSPNLGEAYKFFTGKDMVGAHNAAADILACKAVYFGIQARTAC